MQVNYNQWDRPPIFNLIQEHGVVPEEDMRATFNLGIGLVVIAPPSAEQDIFRIAAMHMKAPLLLVRYTSLETPPLGHSNGGNTHHLQTFTPWLPSL